MWGEVKKIQERGKLSQRHFLKSKSGRERKVYIPTSFFIIFLIFLYLMGGGTKGETTRGNAVSVVLLSSLSPLSIFHIYMSIIRC